MAKATCKIEGCDDPATGRGWCNMHYQRWQSNGDPLIVKRRAKQAETCERDGCDKPGFMRGVCLPHYRELQRAERDPCSVEDCNEPWAARGLCVVHYQRFVRHGSTDAPKETGRPCSVDGCSERTRARDYCSMHYRNWRKYGTPERPVTPKPQRVLLPCIHDGCPEMGTRLNGMCNRHYRWAIAAQRPPCSVEGCDEPASRGTCERHRGISGRLVKMYGITKEQYAAMLASQGGRCKICRRLPEEINDRVKRLVIDHDHACCPSGGSCGKCVRGLLCGFCNRLIGMANDDPEVLRAAIAYLAETKPGQLALFAA